MDLALENDKDRSMNPIIAQRGKVTGAVALPPDKRARRAMRRAALVDCCLVVFLRWVLRAHSETAATPFVIGPTKIRANLVVLPDGSLETYSITTRNGLNRLVRTPSTDNGRTRSEAESLREHAIHGAIVALLDRQGEAQLFARVLRTRSDGKRIAVDRFIDIWQLPSSGGRRQWSEPRRIFEGYVGFVQGALQLSNGRIVLIDPSYRASPGCLRGLR